MLKMFYCHFQSFLYVTVISRVNGLSTTEVGLQFKFGDMYELFQPTFIDAFEFEYNFLHVRAFTYILSEVLAK